jgi:hypothetical protein
MPAGRNMDRKRASSRSSSQFRGDIATTYSVTRTQYDPALGGIEPGSPNTSSRARFGDDSWADKDWENRTHKHYGVRGYWDVEPGVP